MLVKEIMVTDLVSIDTNKSIFDTCELYKKHKVGCLVVTDNGACVGIVTERNLIERCICMRRDPDNTPISYIMTSDVVNT